MEIDKKRVVHLTSAIALVVLLLMLMPKAMHNNQRYKHAQAKQHEERTLQFSTPATTDEQKAILQSILPTYELFMPPPKNGEEDKPTYPSEENTLFLVEETPYCSLSLDDLKIKMNAGFEEEHCTALSWLIFVLHGEADKFTVLIPDLLKANKSPWMNPNPGLKGIYLLNESDTNDIYQYRECGFQKDCGKKLGKEFENARAYMVMSRAIISTDKKNALIYVEYHTWMFSYGHLVHLNNIDGRWVIDETRRTYIT